MGIMRLVTVSLVAGLLAVGACKKDNKDAGAAAEGAGEASKPSEGEPSASDTQPGEGTATATPTAAGEDTGSVSPEMMAMAEKMVHHLDAIGNAAEANKTDCKKAASAMKEAAQKAKPDIEKAKAMKQQGGDAFNKWFEEKYKDRLEAFGPKMIAIAQACGQDPGFMAAMQEMSTIMGDD
jgi:hypothetical protein